MSDYKAGLRKWAERVADEDLPGDYLWRVATLRVIGQQILALFAENERLARENEELRRPNTVAGPTLSYQI